MAQIKSNTIRIGLELRGATIGNVVRPTALSPSVSLKSCAWIVVAKTPALVSMDVTLILPRDSGFLPKRGRGGNEKKMRIDRGKEM